MASKPVKVGQLNSYIKRVLQSDPLLGNVTVIGEISNLKFHGSGHVYFTLKDETSKISCFLAAQVLPNIRFEMAEGMEVIIEGFIGLYERGGSYSLHVRDMRSSGIGTLQQAFEALKEKLSKEGIFDPGYKKKIPEYPRNIAVVTSDTGAAVQDILKIIKTRNNIVNVYVCPVLVQGPQAAPDISSMIDEINETMPFLDTIIVGRGGGSMEELWAFNEEMVARSIFNSRIPVISAVGHETDFTISDFAADVRAETPTAAAVMAVPDVTELKIYVDELEDSLHLQMNQYISGMELRLGRYDAQAMTGILEAMVNKKQLDVMEHFRNIGSDYSQRINEYIMKVENLKTSIDHLHPMHILERGYAAVTDEDGRFLSKVSDFSPNQKITVKVSDGSVDARVEDVRDSNG